MLERASKKLQQLTLTLTMMQGEVETKENRKVQAIFESEGVLSPVQELELTGTLVFHLKNNPQWAAQYYSAFRDGQPGRRILLQAVRPDESGHVSGFAVTRIGRDEDTSKAISAMQTIFQQNKLFVGMQKMSALAKSMVEECLKICSNIAFR